MKPMKSVGFKGGQVSGQCRPIAPEQSRAEWSNGTVSSLCPLDYSLLSLKVTVNRKSKEQESKQGYAEEAHILHTQLWTATQRCRAALD